MNVFLSTGHLPFLLLLAGLFLPRLTLAVAWLLSSYPPNALPSLLDFVLWLFVPRFLIAFYIYTDTGPGNLWFWAYVITGIFSMVGEPVAFHRRVVRRRTTVSRDGQTTTTVEEEEI